MKPYLLLLSLLILTSGCIITEPTCRSPYIEYQKGSCCIDANNNDICDSDETTTTIPTTTTTLTGVVDYPSSYISLSTSEIQKELGNKWQVRYQSVDIKTFERTKLDIPEIGFTGLIYFRVFKFNTSEEAVKSLFENYNSPGASCGSPTEYYNKTIEKIDVGDIGYLCSSKDIWNREFNRGSDSVDSYVMIFAKRNVVVDIEYDSRIRNCDALLNNCLSFPYMRDYVLEREAVNGETIPKLINLAKKQEQRMENLTNS